MTNASNHHPAPLAVGDTEKRDGDRQFSNGEFFIDCFGGDQRKIVVRGVVVYFSWSDRFGPLPETKKGDGRYLSWRHPFWRAASLWDLQGRREEDGACVWHEPKNLVLKHMGGKHYLIIEDGEEGHDW